MMPLRATERSNAILNPSLKSSFEKKCCSFVTFKKKKQKNQTTNPLKNPLSRGAGPGGGRGG